MIVKLGDDHQVHAKKKGVVHLGGVDIEAFFVPEFRISPVSRTTRLTRIYVNIPIRDMFNC